MNKPLCIYHGNCADGFGAAWAVRKALGEGVEFHAGVYQTEPPDVKDRDVILVDFSYKRPVLLEMASKARSLVVLDHHKSASEDLQGLPTTSNWHQFCTDNYACRWDSGKGVPYVHFDMDKSGARIAWEFFAQGGPCPKLIEHIEDRDLWRFKLKGTREIQAALFSYPYDFDVWDKLMASNMDDLEQEGTAIERKHFKDIKELLATGLQSMVIGGHNVPVANLPYTMSSDGGNILAENELFGTCYYDNALGRNFSLRSTDKGEDVSEIAKRYGGGGHRNAAGFRMPLGWSGDAV